MIEPVTIFKKIFNAAGSWLSGRMKDMFPDFRGDWSVAHKMQETPAERFMRQVNDVSDGVFLCLDEEEGGVFMDCRRNGKRHEGELARLAQLLESGSSVLKEYLWKLEKDCGLYVARPIKASTMQSPYEFTANDLEFLELLKIADRDDDKQDIILESAYKEPELLSLYGALNWQLEEIAQYRGAPYYNNRNFFTLPVNDPAKISLVKGSSSDGLASPKGYE